MSQRHAADVVSLVFGTLFAGSAVVWLVDLDGHLNHHNSWWVGPVVLVTAGVAGLVASLRPGRDAQEPSEPAPFRPEPSADDLAPLEDEPAR